MISLDNVMDCPEEHLSFLLSSQEGSLQDKRYKLISQLALDHKLSLDSLVLISHPNFIAALAISNSEAQLRYHLMSKWKLHFYSGSPHLPTGKGEYESSSEISSNNFLKLSTIYNWCKVLSNFYSYPIVIKNKTYLSVEHYYQSEKFRRLNPEYADLFTMEADSPINKSALIVKRAGSANNDARVPIDPLFYKSDGIQESLSDSSMRIALLSKFTEEGLPRTVLLLTKGAELWHSTKGLANTRQFMLEEIRDA
jgi:hypothetical protein